MLYAIETNTQTDVFGIVPSICGWLRCSRGITLLDTTSVFLSIPLQLGRGMEFPEKLHPTTRQGFAQ